MASARADPRPLLRRPTPNPEPRTWTGPDWCVTMHGSEINREADQTVFDQNVFDRIVFDRIVPCSIR
ncbi:hypothetical protein ACFQ1S_24105 [Kibdelosporangium lantanae]|uniref:Uncharacterized protein n=1 Tax=Kibdelosporangium lantanae TaxID=1497396 RepID=A0ABW3MCM8_9PSEU